MQRGFSGSLAMSFVSATSNRNEMPLRCIFQSKRARTMITRTFLLLISAAATASALSEENINQQLDGAPGGKIIIDVDFGTIDVSAGADDKVVIEAHRKIDSKK